MRGQANIGPEPPEAIGKAKPPKAESINGSNSTTFLEYLNIHAMFFIYSVNECGTAFTTVVKLRLTPTFFCMTDYYEHFVINT